jgi:hypothetical protein
VIIREGLIIPWADLLDRLRIPGQPIMAGTES